MYRLSLTKRYWTVKKDPIMISVYSDIIGSSEILQIDDKYQPYCLKYEEAIQELDIFLPVYGENWATQHLKKIVYDRYREHRQIYTDASKTASSTINIEMKFGK